MRDFAVLFLHMLATVAWLVGPGGARSVVAESVLVKHQLLILNRSRKRSPKLSASDRVVAGLCALFMRPVDPFRDRPQTVNTAESASSVDAAEVSPTLLVQGADEAGSEGTRPGSPSRGRRHEAAESNLGVSTDRATNHVGLRDSHHQGCRAAHSRRCVPAGTGLGWAILAHGPRSREGSVCGVSICFDASRPCCAHTACSS